MSDPYIDNVELLCNFDGADAATSYTSEVGYNPVFAGNAQIDTAFTEFTGGASILLNGTVGTWADFGATQDFDWMHSGLESWTFEAIIKPTLLNGDNKTIWDTRNTTTGAGVQIWLPSSASTTKSKPTSCYE
jgi:hypothetical protein